MKSRDTLLRACKFEAQEKRRKLDDIETMIADFRRMATDLEQQIEAEHVRSGVRDPQHFAYSPFAKAARKRCDNLLTSVEDLVVKQDVARQELERAEQELVRVQQAEDRDAGGKAAPARLRGRSSRAAAYRGVARSV